jgi:hypothetical protein
VTQTARPHTLGIAVGDSPGKSARGGRELQRLEDRSPAPSSNTPGQRPLMADAGVCQRPDPGVCQRLGGKTSRMAIVEGGASADRARDDWVGRRWWILRAEPPGEALRMTAGG